MKKVIAWVQKLSNGESAIYFGLTPTFLIAPIWQSELIFIQQNRELITGLVLLLLITLLVYIYFWIKKYRYHIFISYRTSKCQYQWIEALAKNLQQQGYEVFLDTWEIQGGQNSADINNKAVQSSRFALLITDDASESDWIQREYESLSKQQQENPEFRCIPIILGEFSDSPFLELVQAIDFKNSSKDNYAVAFQCLICALENKAPGPNPYFKKALEIPDYIREEKKVLLQQKLSFIEEIFNCLDMGSAVMVLKQADTTSQHYSNALLKKAQKCFGTEHCLEFSPPASSDISKEDYFLRISDQCDFSELKKSACEWGAVLDKRLKQGELLFVLITGFENGSDKARKGLASELHRLFNRFPHQLKLVIFGAEKLAAMKYRNYNLPLFNQLEEKRLPELDIQDLQYVFNKRYSQLKEQKLAELFNFTGQNPRLIQACLQNNVYTASECEQYLTNSSLPSQLFSHFQYENKQQLCQYLQKQKICNYSVWPQDKLVRKLYWNNLIKRSQDKFIWRCEYIQKIGKQNLECNKL